MTTAALGNRGARLEAHAVLVWGTLFAGLVGCSDPSAPSSSQDGEGFGDASAEDAEDGGLSMIPGRGPPSAADAPEAVQWDAGGGDADKNPGPPPLWTPKLACDMRAERQCARMAECTGFRLRTLFGKVETCRARVSAACAAEASLDDSGHTTYSLLRCAQDMSSAKCSDVIDDRESTACRPAGRRREGAGCAAHSQCASTFCEGLNGGCGTCQPRHRVDEGCSEDAACMDGLVCSARGKCIKPGEAGAVCDDLFQGCQTHLACVQGRCAPPLAMGSTCETTRQCSQAEGALCTTDARANAAVTPLLCRAASVAAPGDICQVEGNTVAHCAGGPGLCVKDAAGAFRCMPVAKDGEPCGNKAAGAGCEVGSRCSAGTCKFGPPAGCGA